MMVQYASDETVTAEELEAEFSAAVGEAMDDFSVASRAAVHDYSSRTDGLPRERR